MPRVSFGTYSLDAPDTWTLSSVILAGPVDEAPAKGMPTTKAVRPFQRNLITTMERVDPRETPESYLKKQLEGLREAGIQRVEGKPTEKLTVAGVQGVLSEQIIPGPGGERVRQMQLIVIKEGIAHVVIASHLDGVPFETARAEFRHMLTSFQ
jgi:hypothetical protein